MRTRTSASHERPLRGRRCGDSVVRAAEGDEERVALRVDLDTVVLRERVAERCRCASSTARYPSPSRRASLVDPSMSVKRRVTVPAGRLGTTLPLAVSFRSTARRSKSSMSSASYRSTTSTASRSRTILRFCADVVPLDVHVRELPAPLEEHLVRPAAGVPGDLFDALLETRLSVIVARALAELPARVARHPDPGKRHRPPRDSVGPILIEYEPKLVGDHLVDRRFAVGDQPHGGDEVVDVGDALLEQVAEPAAGRPGRARGRSRRRCTTRGRARRSAGTGGGSRARPGSPRRSSSAACGCRRSRRPGASRRRARAGLPPSPACPTTSKPCSSSNDAMPSRSSTESSASTTRSGFTAGSAPGSAGNSRSSPSATMRRSLVGCGIPFSWTSPRSTARVLDLDRVRDQDLSAARRLADARRVVDGEPDVAVAGGLRAAAMHAHAHAKRRRPRARPASARCASTAACTALLRVGERREELVGAPVDDAAVVGLDRRWMSARWRSSTRP